MMMMIKLENPGPCHNYVTYLTLEDDDDDDDDDDKAGESWSLSYVPCLALEDDDDDDDDDDKAGESWSLSYRGFPTRRVYLKYDI